MNNFTDDQMLNAIQNNQIVKECYEEIKANCMKLSKNTNCPHEDIDNLLNYLIGKWHD